MIVSQNYLLGTKVQRAMRQPPDRKRNTADTAFGDHLLPDHVAIASQEDREHALLLTQGKSASQIIRECTPVRLDRNVLDRCRQHMIDERICGMQRLECVPLRRAERGAFGVPLKRVAKTAEPFEDGSGYVRRFFLSGTGEEMFQDLYGPKRASLLRCAIRPAMSIAIMKYDGAITMI